MASSSASVFRPRRWLWLPSSLLVAVVAWTATHLPQPFGEWVSSALEAVLVPASVATVVLAIVLLIVIAIGAWLQTDLPLIYAEEPLLSPPRLPPARRRPPVLAVAGFQPGIADSLAFNLAVLAAVSGETHSDQDRRRPRSACVLPAGEFSRRLGAEPELLTEYLAAHPYRLASEVVAVSRWHPSGGELFALERGDRAVEYLKLLVPALRKLYDVVLVACEVEDRYLADAAADLADTFILVGSAAQGACGEAEAWLERVCALGLEQKSAMIVTDKPAGRSRLGDLAGQFLYRAELPAEPAVGILDARGMPWVLDRRLASSRQLELAIHELLPDLFAGSEADAA